MQRLFQMLLPKHSRKMSPATTRLTIQGTTLVNSSRSVSLRDKWCKMFEDPKVKEIKL